MGIKCLFIALFQFFLACPPLVDKDVIKKYADELRLSE